MRCLPPNSCCTCRPGRVPTSAPRTGSERAGQRPRHRNSRSPARRGPWGRREWWPFAAASTALFALLIGSNLPTPLFPVYTMVYDLSSLVLSLLFATYTLLVIPALLVFGPLSDVKGRRELLIGAFVVAAVAAVLFAAAHSLAVLFVAQAVQAMVLGALPGTAAPTLIENDPTNQQRRASATASGMTVAGGNRAAGPGRGAPVPAGPP